MKTRVLILFVLILLSFAYFYQTVFLNRERTSKQYPALTVPIGVRSGWPTITAASVKRTPSLDEMFRYHDPTAETKNNSKNSITLIATGDVIPARSVNSQVTKLSDFLYPYRKTADFLAKSDIVFVNLETPLIRNCPVTSEGMSFCGDSRNIDGLSYAGVNIVSVANNHAGNFGTNALAETIESLRARNIAVTGNGKPAILSENGKRIGFLGYNDIGGREEGISPAYKPVVIQEIAELKKTADLVIVTFHWGVEYTLDPNDRQKELAHAAVDAGADLVIGNHPHWVQGVEQYRGKYIVYAHGNFVFDQMWSQETREGVLGKYEFDGQDLVSIRFYPVVIEGYAQPRFASPVEAEQILHRMRTSTDTIRALQ